MKALLICPGRRTELDALTESEPLSNLIILGKPLLEYWLDFVTFQGADEVCILAADRPDRVRAMAGNVARWGLRAEVLGEFRELTPAQARERYGVVPGAGWLPAPADAIVMDYLPGRADLPLFDSYSSWVAAHEAWMSAAGSPDRVGVHEISPGVWTGLHTRIAPTAQLRAPCWIGDEACIGAGAKVGPRAFVENKAVVDRGAEVVDSVVGPVTYVGEHTELRDSIAWGSTLIHWKLNSAIKVPDSFLLSSMDRVAATSRPTRVWSRLAACLTLSESFFEPAPDPGHKTP